jgi:hypothetical protein
MSVKKRLAAKARMTPKSGHNLVGVDTFETEPGDELYLVDNFPSKEAAKAAMKKRLEADPKEVLHIYSAPSEN